MLHSCIQSLDWNSDTYIRCLFFFSSLLCGFPFLVLELVLLLLFMWQWGLYEEKPFQPMHIMVSIHISIVWHFNMVLRMKMINIDGASFSSIHSLFTVWLLLLFLLCCCCFCCCCWMCYSLLLYFSSAHTFRMAIILWHGFGEHRRTPIPAFCCSRNAPYT